MTYLAILPARPDQAVLSYPCCHSSSAATPSPIRLTTRVACSTKAISRSISRTRSAGIAGVADACRLSGQSRVKRRVGRPLSGPSWRGYNEGDPAHGRAANERRGLLHPAGQVRGLVRPAAYVGLNPL